MTSMIDLLPRDHAELPDDAQVVLEALYDQFERTGEPVSPMDLAFALQGKVRGVTGVIGRDDLSQYVRRVGQEDQVVPTLRAALKLWKVEDLELVDRFYDWLREMYEPGRQHLPMNEFIGWCPREADRNRLKWLLQGERFARISLADDPGRTAISMQPILLDAPSLAEYLAERGYSPLRQVTATQAPRVDTFLRGLELRGFRSFVDARVDGLPNFFALAGRNEAGKSSVLRALRLLSSAAGHGVQPAMEAAGGHRALKSRFAQAPPVMRLVADLQGNEAAAQYGFEIGKGPAPRVAREWLRETGTLAPVSLVELDGSLAKVLVEGAANPEQLYLASGESALAALRDIHRFRRAIAVREGLQSWRFFDFSPSAARTPHLGIADSSSFILGADGSNLPEAINWLGREHPERLRSLADDYRDILPAVESLGSETSLGGNPMVILREQGLTDPLTHADLSDGALRILCLLFLAHHPTPPALVGIEEPENGLYPRIIEALVEVLRRLSQRCQVVVTTHSVTLLNRLRPEELVLVLRDDRGSRLQRASSRADLMELAAEFGLGDQLRMGAVEEES